MSARGLRPGAPLHGTLAPPGSKSIAQRALVCAALAEGDTRLEGLFAGEDVRAALAFAACCAAGLEREAPERARIRGARLPVRPLVVDAGESGTLTRFAAALLALCAAPGAHVEVRARGTMLRRGQPALVKALQGAGVRFASLQPLRMRAAEAPASVLLEQPGSSQEVSALLIALAACGGPRALDVRGPIPSRPYVELTRHVLEGFGAQVSPQASDGGFRVRGPLRAPPEPLRIEPDASLAAVGLAAACLSGGELEVRGIGAGSAQGDVRILEHLRAFGCRAEASPSSLGAGGRPDRGAELDLSGEPDLAPVLAAVAAAAALRGGRSRLHGLGTLQGKESPRIETLAEGLRAAGFEVEAGPSHLCIAPPPAAARPALLDPRGDHRMGFAFGVLGLLVEGVLVRDPGCVAKSWPSFWDDLERLR